MKCAWTLVTIVTRRRGKIGDGLGMGGKASGRTDRCNGRVYGFVIRHLRIAGGPAKHKIANKLHNTKSLVRMVR